MRLGNLIAGLEGARVIGSPDTEVTGIAYDSREVRPGDLFVAIPGYRTDGHLYCGEARDRGASAFVVERAEALPAGATGVVVPYARGAMARLAATFYDHPSRRLWMVGVTGTNGKTTTTHLIQGLLEAAGVPAGLTGTIHTLIGREELPVRRTTPEAPDLEGLLRLMVDRGMQAAVMEVSSHALALARVEGVRYDVGVFTNLTQDHLDFHHTLEEYFAVKARLLEGLGPDAGQGPQAAVVNRDDPYAVRAGERARVPVVSYGFEVGADIRAEDIRIAEGRSTFTVVFPGGSRYRAELSLPGRFNISNALAALSVGWVRGLDPAAMVAFLSHARGVPGRFERIDEGQPFTVIVDYAHTPDGIAKVLSTAREFARGRVVAVFGAGGDRDHGKRAPMGAIAGRLADAVIITTDNPRSEDPQAIMDMIAAGVREAGGRYQAEPDRVQAIRLALGQARPGDVVLILGKGHETYQIFRDRTIHHDDREVARQVLKEMARG
ncbi:UDP-N-acetylmuramoylalanyl-D-glutamate-2, 6-diaminopimelate ligase [Candidatus Hydrogenisulfobacillus filiaventi]|uniref:UDP-N-acetylmuramoyl-L-alanyl-D-glutamate--2,6-diaminopimelate ligase n=1 Tax=Candidatus Hydrogenisulfobacillus filiaventi TaxID=2707344 RepID=A0A6F8ZG71_9FIRM|nr:UDP-N-acetylmuramoyl-L-alanyl-D-glutamate--2,6-diaminopimelate ligase [Bacillota bacterium]CAB1128462.1 UDP-N-acetylmuramoylalanyl-D-glutamate-2, 6-diaminopimelate ligase [Candidatus Hydrogenisulfobacillus filiaventi]